MTIFWDIPKWNRGQTKWDKGSKYKWVSDLEILKVSQKNPSNLTLYKNTNTMINPSYKHVSMAREYIRLKLTLKEGKTKNKKYLISN